MVGGNASLSSLPNTQALVISSLFRFQVEDIKIRLASEFRQKHGWIYPSVNAGYSRHRVWSWI